MYNENNTEPAAICDEPCEGYQLYGFCACDDCSIFSCVPPNDDTYNEIQDISDS